jgi:hypothetical protein
VEVPTFLNRETSPVRLLRTVIIVYIRYLKISQRLSTYWFRRLLDHYLHSVVHKFPETWEILSVPWETPCFWGIICSHVFTAWPFSPRPSLHPSLRCIYFRIMGSSQPPIHWVPGDLSLGVKRPGREADHSPPSSAEVEEWVELYLHSTNTLAWSGAQLKYRDNFTFTFIFWNSRKQTLLKKGGF